MPLIGRLLRKPQVISISSAEAFVVQSAAAVKALIVDTVNNKVVVGQVSGSTTHPSLAFGDGDTGFFESSANTIRVTTAGVDRMQFSSSGLESKAGDPGFILMGEITSATNPVYAFTIDVDTGVGRAAADALSLIAGAVEGLRITEAGGNITYTTVDITEDLSVAVAAAGSPAANPMADDVLGMYSVLLADDSTEESRYFHIHVPRDWKPGTDITIELHYMNADLQVGTNAAIFGIEYTAVNDNEDGTPATTTDEITDTLAEDEAAETMHTTAIMTIAGADITSNDVVGFRLYRKAADGGDTMGGDAAIASVHPQYTKYTI